MAFAFKPNASNHTETPSAPSSKDKAILTLELHKNLQVGPCGASRHDIIYFTDTRPRPDLLEKRLQRIQSSTDPRDLDIYLIEQFEADLDGPTNERGSGRSILKAELVGDEWVVNKL